MTWRENDDLFFKELKEGHAWQKLPYIYFILQGYKVEMPSLTIRENIQEADKWKNSCDLIVNDSILEVKSRNEIFNSSDSFPYDTIIIDTVSGYDAKLNKPLAYIMISKPTGSMLCIRTSSFKKWTIEKKYDNTRKISDNFYVIKKEYLEPLNILSTVIRMNK